MTISYFKEAALTHRQLMSTMVFQASIRHHNPKIFKRHIPGTLDIQKRRYCFNTILLYYRIRYIQNTYTQQIQFQLYYKKEN